MDIHLWEGGQDRRDLVGHRGMYAIDYDQNDSVTLLLSC